MTQKKYYYHYHYPPPHEEKETSPWSKWSRKPEKMPCCPKHFHIRLFPAALGRSSQGPAGVPRNREKLPISTPNNESNLTRYWDFCEKMWHLSHPRTTILLYELADPQGSRSKGRIAVSGWGKSHIFSKISRFLVKFDSFFGVESGNFLLRKSPQNICGLLKKNRNSEKI